MPARRKTTPPSPDPAPNPASIRSVRRYHRAAKMLPQIALDEEHADALNRGMAAAGEEKVANYVRRLLRDAAPAPVQKTRRGRGIKEPS